MLFCVTPKHAKKEAQVIWAGYSLCKDCYHQIKVRLPKTGAIKALKEIIHEQERKARR